MEFEFSSAKQFDGLENSKAKNSSKHNFNFRAA